ncbi:MAG TPA: VOC family protein [Candidatus Dormibacteraeota bacterium]|nr:VOC family protein [Candidatus Dormibacteraeota bacterium]
MLKKILHTGLAVNDLEGMIKLYESLGFEVIKRFHKSDINADVVMVTKGETTFELFEFHDQDHPQVEFIRNHVAIYSDSIEEDVNALLKQGYRLTIPITEGVVFRFAFLQDKAGANYEIATEKT